MLKRICLIAVLAVAAPSAWAQSGSCWVVKVTNNQPTFVKNTCPTPAPTPTPTPAPTPTPTPAPTPTPTPAPTPTPTPTPAPGVPDLALWESNAKTYGQKACDYLNAQDPTTDAALGQTYYDAEKVFLQLASYFPADAAKWNACAERAELVYGDNYAVRTNGGVPAYWNFTEGLTLDFQRNGDAASKNTVHLLATNAAYCADGTDITWTANAALSREVDYCLIAYLNDEKLGAPHRARADQLLTQALGHANQWLAGTAIAPAGFDGAPECVGFHYEQPFMEGLELKTLIAYQEFKPDARIPPVIQALVDHLISRVGVQANGSPWYENCSATPTGPWIRTAAGAPDLNLLIAPAYAYLYKVTGNAKYRTAGDALWSAGVRGAYLDQGKQFNQNYFWSFDYLRYRQ